MNRILLISLPALLAAACAQEETVVIESLAAETAPTEVLSAEERFEAAYVGTWSESGGCASDETKWEIDEGLIRAGDRSCIIADVTSATSLLEAELTDCWAEGESVPDRNISLDVAGTDILYLTTSDGKRHRLERCTPG